MTETKNRKVNVGLVGCGEISKSHMGALKKLKNFKVVALCDIDEKLVAKRSVEWRIPRYYTNFSEMLDKENLSIVSVLTPPNFHVPVAVAAINRGINVVSEKPLTMTSKDSQLIIDTLSNTDVKLTVNYIWLFNKVMSKALALLEDKKLGHIYNVAIEVLHTNNDAMMINKDHWCHKLQGGRFGEMLTHPVYLVQAFVGANLKVGNVLSYKRGDCPWMPIDELNVALEGENCPGHFYISFNAPRPSIQINVYGSKKILNINLLNQTLMVFGNRNLSKIDSFKDIIKYSSKMTTSAIRNSAEYLLRARGESSFGYLYTSFEKSIRENNDPVVTPALAHSNVKIVEEICRSIQSKICY